MNHRPETNTDDRLQQIDRQYRRYRTALVWLVALGFVVNIALFWYASEERPGHALMRLQAARIEGPTALCPGETLRYELDLAVTGRGVFAVDATVWRVTPPATVLFSETRHAVIPQPVTFTVERAWRVPATYIDPATGLETGWQPGQYERRHAVSTTSRSTRPSIQVIPFSIRENCEGG